MELSYREWHREREAPGVYCKLHVGHAVMYCDGCKVMWSPCCGEQSPHPVDMNLVKHLRAQIAQNPEGYANEAKLRAVAGRLAADLTGGTKHGSLPPSSGEP